MATWSEALEEQLVTLVEERPPLYDITLQCYSNRNKKDTLWTEIETELRLSAKVVRKKWENLRTVYNRYKKPAPCGSSGAPRTQRQQWILRRLQFIEPYTKRKESTSNLTRKELCDAATASTIESSEEPESEFESDIPMTGSLMAESTICEQTVIEALGSTSTSAGSNLTYCQQAKWERKGQHGAVDEEVHLVKMLGRTLERLAADTEQEQRNDYISVCCKRIEHRMRMLSPQQLTQFEYELDNLLYRFSQNQDNN